VVGFQLKLKMPIAVVPGFASWGLRSPKTQDVRKWRLKHKAVADSLEEAGDKLFTFTRFPPSQWKSIRASNAIERLHEEFKWRIKTRTVLPGVVQLYLLAILIAKTAALFIDGN
jgi:transposase-like protein